MTTKGHSPAILAILPLAYQDGRDCYAGILQYLAAHGLRWDIHLVREAISREGLFAGQVIRVADTQHARSDEMVNYIQAEFVKRGIDVPSSLTRRIGEFDEAAERLVFDLLEEDGS